MRGISITLSWLLSYYYLPAFTMGGKRLQYHVFGFTMIALALDLVLSITRIFLFSLLVSTCCDGLILSWIWVVFEENKRVNLDLEGFERDSQIFRCFVCE